MLKYITKENKPF